jgi:hypothetical protein
MKYTLFLLAAMVGAVRGYEIGAQIVGVSDTPCGPAVDKYLFETCVEARAIAIGIDLAPGRRLGGNRELQRNWCTGCSSYYPRGTFCFTFCSGYGRRLQVSDEKLLCSEGKVRQEAFNCLSDMIDDGLTCLGNADDLDITIFLSA